MKLKKVRWFKSANSFGLGVTIFSFWIGCKIDANAALKPLIHNIPIDKMSGFTFAVCFRHKSILQLKKWHRISKGRIKCN